ncbi:MAG TPA: protein-export chaperone SecB [Rickettsia endosymbiont of Pyrocoelia pectoralis]|nr:protein-export chaperone SecB [Rickettsia endosymbiont of Pyrocoelia pectoralis]
MSTVNTDTTEEMPHISINAQYIKDLSLENPSAPASLAAALDQRPQVDLSLDINISNLSEENFYEVELNIEAVTRNEKYKLFQIELKYAGVFNLINIAPDQHQVLLSVHCPAMIFPFARKIIASCTQDAGFQPLMIDPIDFGALYHKKLAEHQN